MDEFVNPARRLPITAMVIFRNEREHLRACLPRLRFCEQVIGVDMDSTDGSREVACEHVDQLYRTAPCPIAEPARVEVGRLARHDWILLVDPDEYIPEVLVYDIRQTLAKYTQVGAIALPIRYYFKRQMLTGTVWGGQHLHKLSLIHRQRCELLPRCNEICRTRPGFETVQIEHTDANHIRHHWSASYRDLLYRHLRRYPRLDAHRRFQAGERFRWKQAIRQTASEFHRCLRHHDGWRMGHRGWALSAIFGAYHAMQYLWLWHLSKNKATTASAMQRDEMLPIPKLEPIMLRKLSFSSSSLQSHIENGRSRRVLLVTAAFPPRLAGESTYAVQLAKRLADSGLEVHVLTSGHSEPAPEGPWRLYPVMRDWRWTDAQRLRRVVAHVQPDSVLLLYASWTYGYHPMITQAPTYIRRVKPDCRVVTLFTCAMGAHPPRQPWVDRARRKLLALHNGSDYAYGSLLSESDHVVGLCGQHRRELCDIAPHLTGKFSVIPPGPLFNMQPMLTRGERENLRQLRGIKTHETALVYTGIIAPGKGLDVLLRAMKILKDRGQRMPLMMVGGVLTEIEGHREYARKIFQLIRVLGLQDQVHRLGQFADGDPKPSRWLWAADVAVLPWEDGARLNNSSLANVAAHRLPIVTTRPADPDLALVQGERMFAISSLTPGNLADALTQVANNRELRYRLTVGSNALHEHVFSWDQNIDRLLGVLALRDGIAAAEAVQTGRQAA